MGHKVQNTLFKYVLLERSVSLLLLFRFSSPLILLRGSGILRIEERDLAHSTSSLAQSGRGKVEAGAVEGRAIVPEREAVLLPPHSDLQVVIVHQSLEKEVENVLGLERLERHSRTLVSLF